MKSIAFCIPIMDREDDIKATLKHNLQTIEKFQGRAKIYVNCFDSNDKVSQWIEENFPKKDYNRLLEFSKLPPLIHWHFSWAKNSFKEIIQEDYYSSLDGDNFLSVEEVEQTLQLINSHEKVVFHGFSGKWGDGTSGRLTVPSALYRQYGYCNSIYPRQFDEIGLIANILFNEADTIFAHYEDADVRVMSGYFKKGLELNNITNASITLKCPSIKAEPLNPNGSNYVNNSLLLKFFQQFNAALTFLKLSNNQKALDYYRKMLNESIDKLDDAIVKSVIEKSFIFDKLPDKTIQLSLYSVIKNDSIYLKQWKQHYEDIGVERFFIIDDHSEENLKQYLTSEKFYFFTPLMGDFKTCKTLWIKLLLKAFQKQDSWILTVDSDEFISLDHTTNNIKAYCERLNAQNRNFVSALLIDMLPNEKMKMSEISSENFIEYFDKFFLTIPENNETYKNLPSIKWGFGDFWEYSYRIDARWHFFDTVDSLRKFPLFKYVGDEELNQGFHVITINGKTIDAHSAFSDSNYILPIKHYKMVKLFMGEMGKNKLDAYHERTIENIKRISTEDPLAMKKEIDTNPSCIHFNYNLFKQIFISDELILRKAGNLFKEEKYIEAYPLYEEAAKIYGEHIVLYHLNKCRAKINIQKVPQKLKIFPIGTSRLHEPLSFLNSEEIIFPGVGYFHSSSQIIDWIKVLNNEKKIEKELEKFYFRKDQTPPNPFDSDLWETEKFSNALQRKQDLFNKATCFIIEISTIKSHRINDLFVQGNPNFFYNLSWGEAWGVPGYYEKKHPDLNIQRIDDDCEIYNNLKYLNTFLKNNGKTALLLGNLYNPKHSSTVRKELNTRIKESIEKIQDSQMVFYDQTHLVEKYGPRINQDGTNDNNHLPWPALEVQAKEMYDLLYAKHTSYKEERIEREKNFTFISKRRDGLGVRLHSLLKVIVAAEKLKCKFKFNWLDMVGESKNDITHSVVEKNIIFSDSFITKYYVDLNTLDQKKELKHLATDEINNMPDSHSFIEFRPLEEEVPALKGRVKGKDYVEAFKQIKFSPRYESIISKVNLITSNIDAIAIHMRAGDVVYGRYRFTDRHINKIIPLALVTDIIEHTLGTKKIILFGQDHNLMNYIKLEYEVILANELADEYDFNSAEKAFFELYLMSKIPTIYGNSSGFSNVASAIGNCELINPLKKFTSSEIFKLIDSSLKSEDERQQAAYSNLQQAHSIHYVFRNCRNNLTSSEKISYVLRARELDPENIFFKILHVVFLIEDAHHLDADNLLKSALLEKETLENFLKARHFFDTPLSKFGISILEKHKHESFFIQLFLYFNYICVGEVKLSNEAKKNLLSQNKASNQQKDYLELYCLL